MLVAAALSAGTLGASPLAAAPRDAGPSGTVRLFAEADATAAPEVQAGQSEVPAEPEAQPTDATPKAQQDEPDRPAPRRHRAAAADTSPEPTPEPTPRPTPTPWPTPPGVKGLDVSHWNPDVDFAQAAAVGIRFVFIKASQGVSMRDGHYPAHAGAARSAGIAVGAYHFFDYRKSGRDQARHFLATLRSTTGMARMLPLVVDVEMLSSLGTPNRTRARARLHALLDHLYRRTGRYPMIYTSRHMWRQVVGEPLGFGRYPLWVACWKCDTVQLPRGWSAWRFWQFGQFRFGGGLPRLDGNVYANDADRLSRERQRELRLQRGAEWSASTEVIADLRGYQGKDVRVALGDGPFGVWKPFAQSLSIDLGEEQGPRSVRVQLRSFRHVRSPVLTEDIRVDSLAPAVSGPRLSLLAGVRMPLDGQRVRVQASMSASDATSGIERAALTASCDGVVRARSVRPAAGPDLQADVDRTGCTFRASATDRVRHSTSRRLHPRVDLIDIRRRSDRITFRGEWRTTRPGSALAGTLTRTTSAGATATVPIEGAQFAVVARRGPSSGKLDVIVNDQLVQRVNLYTTETDDRRVVIVANVPHGKHTLKLRASGLSDSRSTGTVVALDAVLVLDRRR